jgi:Protein of unknown function (DUF1670)
VRHRVQKKGLWYGMEIEMKMPRLLDRYESIPKRDFITAVIRLLEEEYKILGSRRIIAMLAEDLEQIHREYFPAINRVKFGDLVWQTTKNDRQRPSYGKKTEDYAVQTVILPMVTKEDVDRRTSYKKGDRNSNYRHREARDIEMMVRLLKSAKEQGGLLSGAELSVIMNRSLTTIGKYLKAYFEKTGEVLPMKGYVISPADIVMRTAHSQGAVDNYIKTYDQVLKLVRKNHDPISITQILGRRMNTVRQYLKLVGDFHPELSVTVPAKTDKRFKENKRSKSNGQMS